MIIIDAGASNGMWIDGYSSDVGNTIYAFEPLPHNFGRLLERYRDAPNVICEPVAIGKENTIVNMFLGPINNQYGGVYWGSSIRTDKFPSDELPHCQVRVIKLSEYWKSYINKPVDILKMNIEGAEYDVFEDLLDAGIINEFKYIVYQDHGIRGAKVIPSVRDQAKIVFPRLRAEFKGRLDFIYGLNTVSPEPPEYLR